MPLPDIAAIERGAKARASVSFGRPNGAGTRRSEDGAQPGQAGPTLNAGANPGGVRRLSAPPADSPIGRSGIYGLDNLPSEITSTNRPGQTPEQHVVKKGDTLTSVCELYFGDPWCWPQLWAENPHVTNPHWIFPGDVLRLRAGAAAAPKAPAAAPGMRLTSNRKGSLDSKSVLLRETGFIDIKALAESAKISGSQGREDHAGHRRPGLRRASPRTARCRPASATRCSWPTPRTRCAPPTPARSSGTWCASTATS